MSVSAYVLVGCTASGKTSVSNELARRTGAIVLSADSMLVYRGMDIGTAKPSPAESAGVDLRGVDLADPDEPFSTGRWLEEARRVFAEAQSAGRDVIVAGGTGLYVTALLRGLDAPASDPAIRAELEAQLRKEGPGALLARAEALRPGSTDGIDRANPRRVVRLLEILLSGAAEGTSARECETPKTPIAGLAHAPTVLHARIESRARTMFREGLLDEVRALRNRFPAFRPLPRGTEPTPSPEKSVPITAAGGIGYAEAAAVLDGTLSVEEAIAQTALRTRRLAKRQNTWWRNQWPVEWIPGPADEADVPRAADAVWEFWNRHGKTPVAL